MGNIFLETPEFNIRSWIILQVSQYFGWCTHAYDVEDSLFKGGKARGKQGHAFPHSCGSKTCVFYYVLQTRDRPVDR